MKNLKEFDELVSRLRHLREEESELKRIASGKTSEVEEVEAEILRELTEQGLDTFKGSAGTVYKSQKFAVKMPQDSDTKEYLKNYLVEKQVFDNFWTINYQSLNSFYKQEVEAAKARGEFLDIPGLNPVMSETLNFRKG